MDKITSILTIKSYERHKPSSNPDDYQLNLNLTGTIFDDLEYTTYERMPEKIEEGWCFPIMEKEGNDNQIYIWQIGYFEGTLYIRNGTYRSPTIDIRAIDAKGGNTIGEQGWIDAKARYKNKRYDGYIMVGSLEEKMEKGMKGEIYKPGKIKNFPVYVSTKINGVRLLVQFTPESLIFRSYLNRRYHHLKYIEKEMENLKEFLPTECTIDGEMYIHGKPLKDIIGAVKTVEKEHQNLKDVVYCIFDIIMDPNLPYEKRYEKLKDIYVKYKSKYGRPKNFLMLKNVLVYSENEIYKIKTSYIERGFEGAIIRRISNGAQKGTKDYEMSLHKPGRSTRIYKLKDYTEEEGIVVGVEKTKEKDGTLGILVIKDKYNLVTRIRHGTELERKTWLKTPEYVIGKKFTFKHVGRNSDTNRPNQPTGVGFRDYE